MWQEQRLVVPTPNGGVLAIVGADDDAGIAVITEYDIRGMVIFRFEYQRLPPGGPSGATVTVFDWDEQVVDRRAVAGVPTPPLVPARLGELIAVIRS